nr:hypothetical protein Iba_chr09fCG0570 [Ipomoea batatas]
MNTNKDSFPSQKSMVWCHEGKGEITTLPLALPVSRYPKASTTSQKWNGPAGSITAFTFPLSKNGFNFSRISPVTVKAECTALGFDGGHVMSIIGASSLATTNEFIESPANQIEYTQTFDKLNLRGTSCSCNKRSSIDMLGKLNSQRSYTTSSSNYEHTLPFLKPCSPETFDRCLKRQGKAGSRLECQILRLHSHQTLLNNCELCQCSQPLQLPFQAEVLDVPIHLISNVESGHTTPLCDDNTCHITSRNHLHKTKLL